MSSIEFLVNSYSHRFLSEPHGSMKVDSYLTDSSFDQLVKKARATLPDVSLDISNSLEDSGIKYWSCTASRHTRNDLELSGNFIVLQKGSSLYVLTGEPGRFVDYCTNYIAQKLYPDLVHIYVTSDELRSMLEDFSSSMNLELRYKKFVAKRMFGEPFTDVHFEKRIEQKDYRLFSFAFEEARKRKGWIDGIWVFSISRIPYEFFVSRNGTLKYYRGNFSDYFRTILNRITEVGLLKRKLFEKRGRIEQETKRTVRPLWIKFESEILSDPKSRKQLVDTISGYKLCTYSVVHEGNPHIYISFVDRADNSSFALRTYGSDSILLIPQIRTSHASLTRFSKFLLDNFREGQLSEFSG